MMRHTRYRSVGTAQFTGQFTGQFPALLAVLACACLAAGAADALAQPAAAPTAPPDQSPAPAPAGGPRDAARQRVREAVKERASEVMITHKDLEYAKAGDHSLKLDLYLPKDAKGPVPLVIWVHGGGWESGSKEFCPTISMIRDGFAAASVEYRLTDVAAYPAQIHDVKAAVRWLRAHAAEYNLDPQKFGAWGGSAGGHLVALLGTSGGLPELEGELGNAEQSSAVQAVCDWYGPADFTVMPGLELMGPKSAVYKLFGGPPAQKKDMLAQASPVTHITADDPPFLIMHGDADKVVNVAQSVRLDEALRAAGVRTELIVLKGEGHAFRGLAQLEKVREFFVRELKPAAAAPAAPTQPAAGTPAKK